MLSSNFHRIPRHLRGGDRGKKRTMRYECDALRNYYTWIKGAGWDGLDFSEGLARALKYAASWRYHDEQIDFIRVRAGKPATFEDVVDMDLLFEDMEARAQAAVWWSDDHDDGGVDVLGVMDVDWACVEAMLREIIKPYGLVTDAEIRLRIDWNTGDPKQGTVRLVEGEEERLAAWIKEIEAKGEDDE